MVEDLRKEERGWEEKWEEIREGFAKLEKKLYERIDKRIEELNRIQIREKEDETSEVRARKGSSSDNERGVTWSRGSRNYGSSGTMWSDDRLSSREG